MKFAIKKKVWREAGFGALEIVFIIAFVGFILGIAVSVSEPDGPPPDFVSWGAFISLWLLGATGSAILAGWLSKIGCPEWGAPAVLRAKYCGAIVGLATLGFVLIPHYVPPPRSAWYASPAHNSCINNLRLIDSAKQQWALEQRKQSTDTPAGSDLQRYLGRGAAGELPYCPMDTSMTFENSYSPNNVATKPTCKISPSTHILP